MKMKPILLIKIMIDLAMLVLFLLLMEYHLISDAIHEWIGVVLFVLFISHNILNYKWYKNLFKGKYSVSRIIQTVINFLLILAMIGCMISSMGISGYIFTFIDFSSVRLARSLHLVSTIWAFILMSFHFGLHYSMLIAMFKNMIKPKEKIKNLITWISRIVLLLVCAGGIYFFIERKMWEEMFLLTEFKFFDFNKNPFVYFLENFSIFTFFTSLSYYLKKILRNCSLKKVKK